MTDLITQEAAHRCATQKPCAQLQELRNLMVVEHYKKSRIAGQLSKDQSDIYTAFEADRLTNPKGWERNEP